MVTSVGFLKLKIAFLDTVGVMVKLYNYDMKAKHRAFEL